MVPHLEVELTLTVNLFLSLILIGLVRLNILQWEVPVLSVNLVPLEVHKLIYRFQEHQCFCPVLFLPHMVYLIKLQWRDLLLGIFLLICSIVEEIPPLIPGTIDSCTDSKVLTATEGMSRLDYLLQI